MKFPVIKFSPEQFIYNGKTKTMVANTSDLEHRHLQVLSNGNRGFSLQLKHNRVLTFILSDTKLFSDDDGICFWRYVLDEDCVKTYPEYVGMTATVFND